jgi:hypothetical protein
MLHMNLKLHQFVHLKHKHKSLVCQTIVFVFYRSVIMSMFVHEKEHLWCALLFLSNQKKKAVESPSIRTCETWFRQFKSGDFNVKKCED